MRYNFALQLKFLSLPRKREKKLVFSYLIRFIGYCSKEGNERGFENQDRIPLDRPNIDEALYGSRTVKFLSVPVIFIAIAVTSNNIFINSLRIVFTWPFGFCTSSSPRLISRINCAAETGDIGGEAQRKRPLPSYFPPKLYTSLYLVSYVFHGATRGDNIAGTNTGNRLPTGLPSQACGFSCHRAAHRFLRQPAGREILSPRREGEEKKSRFFFCPRDIDRSNLNRTVSTFPTQVVIIYNCVEKYRIREYMCVCVCIEINETTHAIKSSSLVDNSDVSSKLIADDRDCSKEK